MAVSSSYLHTTSAIYGIEPVQFPVVAMCHNVNGLYCVLSNRCANVAARREPRELNIDALAINAQTSGLYEIGAVVLLPNFDDISKMYELIAGASPADVRNSAVVGFIETHDENGVMYVASNAPSGARVVVENIPDGCDPLVADIMTALGYDAVAPHRYKKKRYTPTNIGLVINMILTT